MKLGNNRELYHHGIKSQKWGVRRYQNADGSLTNAGKIRYSLEPKYHSKNAYSVRAYREMEKRRL